MDVDEVEPTLHIPETPQLYCLRCYPQTTNGALASFRAVAAISLYFLAVISSAEKTKNRDRFIHMDAQFRINRHLEML